MRRAVGPNPVCWRRSSRWRGGAIGTAAAWVTLGLLTAACSGGGEHGTGHASVGARSSSARRAVTVSITPAGGGIDNRRPGDHGTATGGRLRGWSSTPRASRSPGSSTARERCGTAAGRWECRSATASIATAIGPSGGSVARTSAFRTLHADADVQRPRSSRVIARHTGWGCRSSSTSAGRSSTEPPSSGRSRSGPPSRSSAPGTGTAGAAWRRCACTSARAATGRRTPT